MLIKLLALTQLEFCFLDSATVAYSASQRSADLFLEPNTSTKCGFQDEVNISVLLGPQHETEAFIYDSFAPETPEKITMAQIAIPENLTVAFAYLNVSSLSFFTLVRVAEFQRVRSKLDRCFEMGASQMRMRPADYELALKLTDECQKEVANVQRYDIQFSSYAESLEVDISQNVGCGFDLGAESVLKCRRTGDFIKYIQVPFIQAVVTFYVAQGGSEYILQAIFERPVLGTYSGLYAGGSQLTISELSAHIHAVADISTGAGLETATDGYNRVLLRFLAKNGETGEIFQIQEEMTEFDVSRSEFIFQCGKDKKCLQEMRTLYNAYEDYVFGFDISFFRNSQFLAIVQEYLPVRPSCSSTSLLHYKGGDLYDLQFDFTGATDCRIDLSAPFSVSAEVLNNSAPIPVIYTTKTSVTDGAATIDCGTCKECSYKAIRGELSVVAVLTQGELREYILIDKVRRADYRICLSIVCVLGSMFILVCIMDTASKIVVFRRVVKAARKR